MNRMNRMTNSLFKLFEKYFYPKSLVINFLILVTYFFYNLTVFACPQVPVATINLSNQILVFRDIKNNMRPSSTAELEILPGENGTALITTQNFYQKTCQAIAIQLVPVNKNTTSGPILFGLVQYSSAPISIRISENGNILSNLNTGFQTLPHLVNLLS